MEALSDWEEMCGLLGPEELEVHIHATIAQFEAAKMVRVNQRLGNQLPSGKSECGG
jgi:hypothetical protein